MADDETKQESTATGGNKTLIIIVIAGFVVLIGVVLGVLALTGAFSKEKKSQGQRMSAAGIPSGRGYRAPSGEIRPLGKTIVFDTLIVNLNEPGGTRYLKVKFQLEITNEEVEKEIIKKLVPIRDSLIMYLSSLTLSETQSVEAKKKIKTNVRSRMNKEIISGRINRVFLEEFVVQ
ncbi:MAG: flagellar basal body-associated FliL family protein [Deltaproteobacteria bacterium]|nr:flagellar basal body-associated FliL family protein [Deltaproteobacteria bacterium]